MHYENNIATQDHAGESVACAAANAMNHAIKNENPILTFEELVQAIEDCPNDGGWCGHELDGKVQTEMDWWGHTLIKDGIASQEDWPLASEKPNNPEV